VESRPASGPADGARQAAPVHVVPTTPPTLKVGDINARLGFIVTSALIVKLGFPPAFDVGTKILWHEEDYPRICDALIRHIAAARDAVDVRRVA